MGCLVSSEKSCAQTNTVEDFERPTATFTNTGSTSTGTSTPVTWTSNQANTSTGFITASGPFTNNSLTFNGTTATLMYGREGGNSTFSIGTNTVEWTFLYQTPASVTPADNNGTGVTGNDWRYWVNASGNDPTASGFKGYYVTQDGANLVFYYYCNGCGGRQSIATFAVSANSKYIVRVVHDSGGGGEWQFYATAYTGSSSFPTTSLGSTFDQLGGSSSTYNYSFFQASLSSTANNGIFQWDNVSLYRATQTITGFNAAANGITQGALSYGQTGIVLFGFSLSATGSFTMNQLDVACTLNVNNYLTNGKLYRSADALFSDAVLVTGTTSTFNAYAQFSGLNENVVNGTNYYFIVADLTASTTFTTPATMQFNFTASQSPQALNAPSAFPVNGFTTTNGQTFNIVSTYDWVGTTSNDFATLSNFAAISGGGVGSLPSGNVTVNIGRIAYTNAPSINTSTTIGGLSFGTAVASPTLTIASGKSLTINNNLNVRSGNNATISGNSSATSTLTLANTTTATNIASTAKINFTNVAVNNAGLFTLASTSTINLSGAALTNTGTFTFMSDANGSATLGPLVGTNTITGNYAVQRFLTGGSTITSGRYIYRNYRLMSSSVSN